MVVHEMPGVHLDMLKGKTASQIARLVAESLQAPHQIQQPFLSDASEPLSELIVNFR
jgi:hypothetical protein